MTLDRTRWLPRARRPLADAGVRTEVWEAALAATAWQGAVVCSHGDHAEGDRPACRQVVDADAAIRTRGAGAGRR